MAIFSKKYANNFRAARYFFQFDSRLKLCTSGKSILRGSNGHFSKKTIKNFAPAALYFFQCDNRLKLCTGGKYILKMLFIFRIKTPKKIAHAARYIFQCHNRLKLCRYQRKINFKGVQWPFFEEIRQQISRLWRATFSNVITV